MKKIEKFDFKSCYKDISEDNIVLIQRYFDNKSQTIQSDTGMTKIFLALRTLCTMLNEDIAPDFSKWNINDVNYYMRESGYKSDRLRTLLTVIQDLMELSGNQTDVSHIENLSFCKEYSSSIFTFKDLNTSLQATYKQINPNVDWKHINSWSTTIIICYLFWLGFVRKDIASLKNSDYDARTATIVLNKGGENKRRQITEQPIIEYIERYIASKNYEVYKRDINKTKAMSFMDTESFIKTTSSKKSSTLMIVDNHRKKIHKFFGYTVDEIVDAGRMNRLYFLDKIQRLSIDRDNAGLIAKELDVPLAKRLDGNKSELGYLLNLYPSYKEKREALP